MNNLLSKSDRTRKFIIERTADLFNKKGYVGTSLNDIVKATGLTRGSIYGNFKNKEEVALAAFEYNCLQISGLRADEIRSLCSFHDKLLAHVNVYDVLMLSGQTVRGGCPILNTAVEADDTNPALKIQAAKEILSWKNSLSQLIEQGILAGEFRSCVNIAETAFSIIALIEGGVMLSKVTDDPLHMRHVFRTVKLLIQLME